MNPLLLTSAILAAATAEVPRRRDDPGADTPPDLVPVRWDAVQGEVVNMRVTRLGAPEIEVSLNDVILGHLEPEKPVRLNRAQRRQRGRRG